MATFSKLPFSESSNGKAILVSQTATAGNLIHTAQSGTTGLDEIWLYASNSSTNAVKLTVEYGGTTTTEHIEISIAGESGLILVVPGLVLNNAQAVRAFASTTNVISISGYINRIS